MILTAQDRERIQSELDASYEQALKNYEALVAANAPYLLYIAKPEHIILMEAQPYVRHIKRNTEGTRKLRGVV